MSGFGRTAVVARAVAVRLNPDTEGMLTLAQEISSVKGMSKMRAGQQRRTNRSRTRPLRHSTVTVIDRTRPCSG